MNEVGKRGDLYRNRVEKRLLYSTEIYVPVQKKTEQSGVNKSSKQKRIIRHMQEYLKLWKPAYRHPTGQEIVSTMEI